MLRQPDDNNLLKTLKDGGYHVWWGGKNDLVPAEDGFDDYCHVKYSKGYNELHDPDLPQPRSLYAADRADEWRHPGTDDYYSFYVGRIDKGEAPYYRDGDWAAVEGAIEMIRNAPDDRPLCIYLCLAYPHPPYGVEEPWYSMIDRDKIPDRVPAPDDWSGKSMFMPEYHRRLGMETWTEDRWRELRAVYYGMAARVDHQVGLIVDALKERGIYDETGMFFFSDHGDYTGDYGLVEKSQICFEDCLTHVPFVVKPPKDHAVKPRVSEALVELTDLTATVEAMTGLTMPQTSFGRSLLPLIAGETDSHRDAVFCEGGLLEEEAHFPAADAPTAPDPAGLYYPRQSMQTERIEYFGKATMLRTERYKLINRVYEEDELYDLQDDPAELNNRIHDPAYADVAQELRNRMLRFFIETSSVVPSDFNRRE
jgi:arylsulfatase A-like enzyme